MISKIIGVITLFTLICVIGSVYSRGHYTVVAPGTIRSNSAYFLALSLDEFRGSSAWFNISVISNCGFRQSSPIDYAEVEVQSRSTTMVKMNIPKLTDTCGTLRVVGYRGIINYHSATLHVETQYFLVYIQTDKAKYKPGEVLQFRVICVDRLTRPIPVAERIEALIYDGRSNLIKKFSDISLSQGVFRGNLQLADSPVLGDWKIKVEADGYAVQEKSFEVSRYVLPKFSVDIDTKPDVSINAGRIDLKIRARYTHGQPVRGNLTVILFKSYSRYRGPKELVTKCTTIDGEADVYFQLNTNACENHHALKLSTFEMTANVTDDLTGQTRSGKAEVHLYCHPYKVQLKALGLFDPQELLNITVSVKDLQGHPIWDKKTPITVRLTATPSYMEEFLTETDDFKSEVRFRQSELAYLNESGLATVSINVSYTSEYKFFIFAARVEYLNWISHETRLNERITNIFQLNVLTEKPEVGKDFVIEILSKDPIQYFVYQILSRGDIIHTERINVPGNEAKYNLGLTATYPMVPKITLYVHRIIKGVFDCQLKEIYIKRKLQNSIEITTEDQVKPGESVSINVTTDKDSYVGLMGIDESLLLETKQSDDLNEDNVYTRLRNFDAINMNTQIYPGSKAGLITFSNSRNRAGYEIDRPILMSADDQRPADFDKPSIELPYIRKVFSESWMFQDFESIPNDHLQLHETIPDTITFWSLTGFSLNPITGLGLTKNPTKLKVFQEFFISMDLPTSVKVGEIIQIPVYVFNYMDEDVTADVTIESPHKDIKIEPNQQLSKLISARDRKEFVFFLQPLRPGRYNVTAKALSPVASDAIQKTLIVDPEGMPFSITKTYLVHFLQESSQEDQMLVEIPNNTVRDSESVRLSVVGDIFGNIVTKIEKLVRVPHGNGEENLRFFLSNLLVLKYLKAVNHSSPVIENKAKLYLELGYQTQLTFKHLDGSFGSFDRRASRTGEVWLTAFVMWALQLASEFIQIDPEVIRRGLNYLESKQFENGSFDSGSGLESHVTLTAFTLLAFLVETKSQNQYGNTITNGLKYLYENLDDIEQPTSRTMSVYALVLGKHEKSEELRSKMTNSSKSKGEQRMWTKPDTIQSNIETAAYSLMSLLETQINPMNTLLPIVKSLMSFEEKWNTPAHMVALEAMIKFAELIDLGRNDIQIHFEDDQGGFGDLHVTQDNARVLQTVELNKNSRNITLQSKGKGLAMVQLQYKYNLAVDNQSSLNYETNVTINESGDSKSTLEVCVAKLSSENNTNLTVLEVILQTGLSFDESVFYQIKRKNKQIKLIQMKGNDQSVILVLENVTQTGTCAQLEVTKKFKDDNAKPVSVVVFDRDCQLC